MEREGAEVSKRTRSKNAMEHRRKIKRIRRKDPVVVDVQYEGPGRYKFSRPVFARRLILRMRGHVVGRAVTP